MIFVIKLDKEKEEFYKDFTDYGFKSTKSIEEATRFKTQEEAESRLKSYGVRVAHPNAFIERIR